MGIKNTLKFKLPDCRYVLTIFVIAFIYYVNSPARIAACFSRHKCFSRMVCFGIWFCHAFNFWLSHLGPAIVLMTSRQERDKIEAFELGVSGYMIKPVGYIQFVEAVKTIDLYWTLSELPE